MKLQITIKPNTKNHRGIINVFTLSLIQRQKADLQLDAESFYLKWTKSVPEDNVEILVVHSHPYLLNEFLNSGIRIHMGNDQKPYICYPPRLESFEEAKILAEKWCIITTFQLQTGIDPNKLESFGNEVLESQNADETDNDLFMSFAMFILDYKDVSISIFDMIPLWIESHFQWIVESKEVY